MAGLGGNDRRAAIDWAACQIFWQTGGIGRCAAGSDAFASVRAFSREDLTASCTNWADTHLPADMRRRLNRATSDQTTGHLTAGLVLLLALCGWVHAGDDGAQRAVVASVPPATPPLPSTAQMHRRYRARRLERWEAPRLFAIAGSMCDRARLTNLPDIYVLPDIDAMNAYALGNRDAAAITLTEGLLSRMTPDEVAAIVAHELAHVCNDDGATMALAFSLQRAISWWAMAGALGKPAHVHASPSLAYWVFNSAPAIAELLCLGLSRVRELAADALALDLIADPRALSSALLKLDRHHQGARPPAFDASSELLAYLHSHPLVAQRVANVQRLS